LAEIAPPDELTLRTSGKLVRLLLEQVVSIDDGPLASDRER
jgi:hypothetical protein